MKFIVQEYVKKERKENWMILPWCIESQAQNGITKHKPSTKFSVISNWAMNIHTCPSGPQLPETGASLTGCVEHQNMNASVNKNSYIAHKKLPHKTLRIHSTRYTHSIHETCKLSQAKTYRRTLILIKYTQPLCTHPFPKVQLYIVVKCSNIYRVTNGDNRKKETRTDACMHTHIRTCTHVHMHTHTHNHTHISGFVCSFMYGDSDVENMITG